MRNERRRLIGHVAALAAGVALALIATSSSTAAPERAADVAAREATVASPAQRDQRPAVTVRSAALGRATTLPARIASKLDELGRGEDYARLRPYFPATERGAQLAAYTTLYGDIPDPTEAGYFARRDLLPDLLAHPGEAAAAARTALLAMPRGDGELYIAKEMLVNFVSGNATMDAATIASVLGDYLAAEDPASEAYSLAENRLRVARMR